MMILDYKADKEGKYFDLSQGITVTKIWKKKTYLFKFNKKKT